MSRLFQTVTQKQREIVTNITKKELDTGFSFSRKSFVEGARRSEAGLNAENKTLPRVNTGIWM
jgi:hypothetical protein